MGRSVLKQSVAFLAGITCVFALICLFVIPLSAQWQQAHAISPTVQADGSDSDSDESDDPEETPIDKAKRLISALPADPDAVTEEHRAALDEAQAAYDALGEADRATLDSEYIGKEQTYGRWLEAAQWGLMAKQPVDNTLDLIDGDYSDYVSSASSMGKSTSARAKAWFAATLIISEGSAWAVIRCDSTSAFRNMRVGGIDYQAKVEGGVPEFMVPVVVNDTMTVTFDANDIADSIAVQIMVTLPLDQASSSEVSASKSAAQKTLSGDLSVYTDESAASLKEAANALMQAASKSGVTTIELNLATANLNSAIAKAVKKPVEKDSKKTSPSQSGKKGKSGKAKSSSSAKKGSSQSSASKSSQTAPKASTATPARTTGASNLRAPSVSSASKSASSSSASSKSASSKSASSSAASAKASAADDGADMGDGDPKQATVTELSASSGPDDETITRVVIVLGILGFVLAGMCARTFLFVRSKEVA